jgi:hypothetical protein
MVVIGHQAPGEDLKAVALLGRCKEGFESIGLGLVAEDVCTARNPVVHMVDPASQQNPRATTHPLSPAVSVETS